MHVKIGILNIWKGINLNFKIKTLSYLILACLFTSQTYAINQITKSLDKNPINLMDSAVAQISFGSEYLSQDSQLNKASRLQLVLGAIYQKQIIEEKLSFHLETSLALEEGTSDSLYDNNELEASNDIRLREAKLNWLAADFIEFQAGALSFKEMEHDLLFSKGAMLAFKESLFFGEDNFQIKLSALQARPSTQNYSNRIDNVDEGTPNFFMESVYIKLQASENFLLESMSSHFAFDNLSNSVAAESLYNGNTVFLQDKNSGEFAYSYIGWAQSLKATVSIEDVQLVPYFQYVINNAAPVSNTANLYGVELNWLNQTQKYSLIIEQYKSEADASVAYYNSLVYGHNNMQGNNICFKYEDLAKGYEAQLFYASQKEIEINQLSVRDDNTLVGIEFRKTYDIF